MDQLTNELINLLQYLLPGFISAWIFYSLTSFKKGSQFERIIQALIFNMFIQLIVLFIKKCLFLLGNYLSHQDIRIFTWTSNTELTWSIIGAILLGVATSFLANNDIILKKLRDWNLSRESSHPSVWYGALREKVTYIVLHLDGERRLFGWPKEWPPDSEEGHILITNPSWLDGDNQIEMTGVESILVDVKEIEYIEFMKTGEEEDSE